MNILNVGKGCFSSILFAVSVMSSVSAFAIPTNTVYCEGTCITDGEEWSTNGVLWTLSGDAIPGVDTSGTFTLSADVSGWDLGTIGYLAEFSLKNFGADASLSLSAVPDGTSLSDWSVVNADLNASGCKNKATADALCVNNDIFPITAPSTDIPGDIISFTFDIDLTGGLFPDYTHLKVRWVDADGGKIGDLISQDISWTEVPEPGMLGLLAIGLLGIVAACRKKTV